jgi:hypothetical protein
MPDKTPRFAVGDLVCERLPLASREIGTVTARYDFEDDYRYVAKFESGREDVFFEKELLPAQSQ